MDMVGVVSITVKETVSLFMIYIFYHVMGNDIFTKISS